MPASGSIVCRHQLWHTRQPALQSRVCERNLKVRTPCFLPPGHVAPIAFYEMTHSCTLNSIRMATAVFKYGLRCTISGVLFPESAQNSHSSMAPCILSTILGRNSGRQMVFALFIQEHGENSRTSNTPWQCFGRKTSKLYRKTM